MSERNSTMDVPHFLDSSTGWLNIHPVPPVQPLHYSVTSFTATGVLQNLFMKYNNKKFIGFGTMKSSSIDGKIIDMLGWTFSNIFEHKTFSRKD